MQGIKPPLTTYIDINASQKFTKKLASKKSQHRYYALTIRIVSQAILNNYILIWPLRVSE